MIWVLLPHLSRAAKDSIQRMDEEGQGYLKGIAVITAGLALFMAAVLVAISPVIVLHAFSYFFDLTMTAVGKQRLIIVGAGLIFLVKLIVDLIFVPTYGIMGAALGTLASDLACFSVMFFLMCKHVTSFHFGRIMVKPFWAALAAGVLLWLIRAWPFYITVVIFGVSYLIFIWVFRVVSPDQQLVFREMTRGLMRKVGLTREDSNGSDDLL